MTIKELFPFSINNWITVNLYGENFLINQNNVANKVQYENCLGTDLYSTFNSYLFTFQNRLFEICKVKKVGIIDGKDLSGKDNGSKILMILDEKEIVHFHVFFTMIKENLTTFTIDQEVQHAELGRIAWRTLYLFKPYLSYPQSYDVFVEETAETFKNGFFYPSLKSSKFHISRRAELTFFRFNSEKLEQITFNDTYMVFNSNNKTYIKMSDEIFDVETFKRYNIRKFCELTSYPNPFNFKMPVVYHLKNGKTLFLFKKTVINWPFGELMSQTASYLWDADEEKLLTLPSCDFYPGYLPKDAATPIEFWHHETTNPHITVETVHDKKIYRIWYQEPFTGQLSSFVSEKKPIFIKTTTSDEIIFIEAKNSTQAGFVPIMIIFDEDFVIKNLVTGVSLQDIINKNHKYPIEPHTLYNEISLTDKPQTNLAYYELTSDDVLILKNYHGSFGEYTCYFVNSDYNIDNTLSFFNYIPISTCDEKGVYQTKSLKVSSERNGSDYENKDFYIDLENEEMIPFEYALKKALKKALKAQK